MHIGGKGEHPGWYWGIQPPGIWQPGWGIGAQPGCGVHMSCCAQDGSGMHSGPEGEFGSGHFSHFGGGGGGGGSSKPKNGHEL